MMLKKRYPERKWLMVGWKKERKKKKQADCASKKHLLINIIRHATFNTSFIPSEIKFASFSGLAQFEHPHHFLSQQKPLTEWSDETRMLDMLRWLVLGMSMIPKPQWGCDKMCRHCCRRHFPQTQPSGLLRLLACITVPPNVRKVPSWQRFMCEDNGRVNSLSSKANTRITA